MSYEILTNSQLFQNRTASDSNTIDIAVIDENGVPASGVSVDWYSDHGSLESETTVTDSSGGSSNILNFDSQTPNLFNLTLSIDDVEVKRIEVISFAANLQAPYVTNTTLVDGIHQLEGNYIESVQVMVLPYATAAFGDRIKLFWGQSSNEIIYTGTNLPFILNVRNFFGTPSLVDGLINVYYEVIDIAQNSTFSAPVNLNIVNSPFTQASLLAPLLPDNPTSIINYESALSGTRVVIPGEQDIQVGNGYSLRLIITRNEVTLFSGIVKEGVITEPGGGDEITLPPEVFEGYDNARGVFYYTITSLGEAMLSQSKLVIIDTVAPGIELISE